uniref:Solute carrier family 16 member 12b n=1 Tax=Amphiprion percula TaxID=161767 RepID=A0A3P8SNR2_AMPPE
MCLCSSTGQPADEPLVLQGGRDAGRCAGVLRPPDQLLQQEPGAALLQHGSPDRSGFCPLLHARHRPGGLLLPAEEGAGVRRGHVGQRDRDVRVGAGSAAADRAVLVEGALLVLSAIVANLCVCGALLRPITLQEEMPEGAEQCDEKQRCDISPQDAELAIKPFEESKDALLSADKSLPPSTLSLNRKWCFSSWFLSSKEYQFLLLPDFLGLALSFLFLASGCSLPFVYLVPYALSAGVSHQHAAFLMSILGVIDIMGNVTFGWLTDRRCLKPHRLSCYVFSVGMEGLCCLFIPLLRSFSLLVPFAVLYGYLTAPTWL